MSPSNASLIRCELCPKECTLGPWQRGDCRVRVSDGEKLVTLVYGKPCAVNVDPIEKKPMFHFLPGSGAFSIVNSPFQKGVRQLINKRGARIHRRPAEDHAPPCPCEYKSLLSAGHTNVHQTPLLLQLMMSPNRVVWKKPRLDTDYKDYVEFEAFAL